MDFLRAGSHWLQHKRREQLSSRVVYLRAAAAVEMPATIGKSNFELADANGMLTTLETRDYLIDVRDLVIDGAPATPSRGDRIVEPVAGSPAYPGYGARAVAGPVYEVLDVPGQGCFRWSDSFRQCYRIHTKFVGMLPIA